MNSKKSIVFLSTPTSGTGSLLRMIQRVAENSGYKFEKVVEKFWLEGRISELSSWVPEEEGYVYLYNQPAFWRAGQYNVDFIFNFRDPRDLVCNQYSWVFSHPDPSKTDEELEEARKLVREKGIDSFVIEKDLRSDFSNLVQQMEICSAQDNLRSLYLSYAGLCLDFENVFQQIVSFFDASISFEDYEYMAKNSVENLTDNGAYIGNLWIGADIAPGRFLNELSHETIDLISDRYQSINNRLSFFERFGYSNLLSLRDPVVYKNTISDVYKKSLFNRGNRSPYILMGKNSNLFLRYDSNCVLEQAAGIYNYSESAAYQTAMIHAAREEFIYKKYGLSYFHCVIPNKETVLSEYLPSSFFEWNDGGRPFEKYKELGAHKIWNPFFDPSALKSASNSGYPVKTDSHWDHEGALTYLKAFFSSDPRLSALKKRLDDLPLNVIESEQQGDLGGKLYIGKEPIKILAPKKPSGKFFYWNEVPNEGSIRIFKNENASGRLFVLHDSFSLWLFQFLAELFSEIVFLHTPNFDPCFFEKSSFVPDFVFFFQAERFFVRPPMNGVSYPEFIEAEEIEKVGGKKFDFSDFCSRLG